MTVSSVEVTNMMRTLQGVTFQHAKTYASMIFEPSSKIKTYHEFVMNGARRKEGLSDVSIMPTSREAVEQAETILISQIAQKYLQSNHRVIEIGAGKLDSNGCSYLMQRLPKEFRSLVIPTDINRALAQADVKIMHLDTVELEKMYPAHSVDRFLGSAMLDTMSEEDLNLTLKQVHSTLCDNGLLIHVSSLEPYKDAFVSAHSNEDTVCFPWVSPDSTFQGLQIISKRALLSFLDSDNHLPSTILNFLRWYAEISHQVRELMLNMMIMEETQEKAIASKVLSRVIQNVNPPGLRTVRNSDFFEQRVQEALKNCGFEILECGYRTATEILDRPPNFPERFNTDNSFSLINGHFSRTQRLVLAVNKIYQHVKMHVVVAQVRR